MIGTGQVGGRHQGSRLILRNARLADGALVDVEIDDGVIAAVIASTQGDVNAGAREPARAQGSDHDIGVDVELRGYLLLPSPVEPHAHLDKALLASRVSNPSQGLDGAVTAMREAYATMTEKDIARRALLATVEAISHGFTAIRTHADCGDGIGSRSVRVLVELREQLRDVIDLQVVAMVRSITGSNGASNVAMLNECMLAGADLVGAAPWREPDPRAALDQLFDVAGAFKCGVDFHMDETTDTGTFVLLKLIAAVRDQGFGAAVTASHCVSLGMQIPRVIRETSRTLAVSGISVVALPQSNLYLQGRNHKTKKLRGITPVGELLAAGVTVAGGGDNWRDPFNPMGRIDAFETASLLVSAAHLSPQDAYACVSRGARASMGLPSVTIACGSPADLLAIRAESLDEAIAGASEQRMVIKAGRIVSNTTQSQTLLPSLHRLVYDAGKS